MSAPVAPVRRFDGAAAWMRLPPEVQAAIGTLAIELGVAMIANDLITESVSGRRRERRALAQAYLQLYEALIQDVAAFCSLDHTEFPPVPSLLGQVCRVCGCSEEDACEDGCSWVEEDLCSACAGKP